MSSVYEIKIMHVVFFPILYICIGIFWWLIALTVGLPLTVLLVFREEFRRLFFSWVYATIVEPFQRSKISVIRSKAFQNLMDSLGDRSNLPPLEILEIGVGHGPNLKFYPENCKLTVLDKNKFFEKDFSKNRDKYSHISYQGIVIQPAECMKGVGDNLFDVVVSTYLHCSSDNSSAVLREVKRVLKPGGKYLFLDHTGFPEGDIGLIVQKFYNPLWALTFDGCRLDKDPSKKIKEAGFSDVQFQKLVSPNFRRYLLRHQIVGLATK